MFTFELKTHHVLPHIGKQLFERNRHLDDETNLIEEGSVSVDASQYDRTERLDEEIEPERVELSDSD